VFRNRQATAIKILAYDGQGFWLCQKRLSSGRFRHWLVHAGNAAHPLLAHELHLLLMAGDPEATGAKHARADRVCHRRLSSQSASRFRSRH
jgi:hypothetical protein